MYHETAIHEAGHLVAAYRLGHYCGCVSIVPGADTLGRAMTEGEWGDGSRDEEVIVVLLAGGSSQRAFYPEANLDGCHSDEEQVRDLLATRPEGSEQRLREKVAELVRANREAIVAVAEALVQYKTLDGDEATIIVDALDEGEDWRAVLAQLRAVKGID